MQIVNRETKEITNYEPSKFVKFMYEKPVGRIFLKLLSNKVVANLSRVYMNTPLSIPYKNKIIKKYNIDMSLYEDKNYNSYNSYFVSFLKSLYFLSSKLDS